MCRVLEVSISGYYASRGRPESKRCQENRLLTAKITAYFEDSKGTYGAYRIQQDLRDEKLTVSRHRIHFLMRQAGLIARCKQKSRTTTRANSSRPVAENVLNRDFVADGPNQKWVTDITYLPTTEGWLYLQ